jgi:hypothetical protein
MAQNAELDGGVLEGVSHGACRLPAVCRILCKSAVNDFANDRWNVRRPLPQRHRRLLENGANRLVDTRFAVEA